LDSNKSFAVRLSGNLTKSEVIYQINLATKNIKKHFKFFVDEIKIDFIDVTKVDTYALVFIIHIERLKKSLDPKKKLNLVWINVPSNLLSLIELSSLTNHLDIR
jgi:ABC-type transporter Mla MlaB component